MPCMIYKVYGNSDGTRISRTKIYEYMDREEDEMIGVYIVGMRKKGVGGGEYGVWIIWFDKFVL